MYLGEFIGIMMHSYDYCSLFELIDMCGKCIIVVGMGNFGMDLVLELLYWSIVM